MAAKSQVAGSVGMHRNEAEGTCERSDAPEGAARRCAGFLSPAEQYREPPLDLNELLVKRPAATFFVKVEGDSMINAGIHDKDLLVVDRSLAPANGKIIISGEIAANGFTRSGYIFKGWAMEENGEVVYRDNCLRDRRRANKGATHTRLADEIIEAETVIR